MEELLIQHEQDGQVIKRFRVKPKDGLFTIGSGRNCNIRILGDDVDIIHACVEYRNNSWLIIDLCSESGTRIKNDSIVECSLDNKSDVYIGVHKLTMNPVHLEEYNLFKESKKINVEGKDAKIYQQVVVFYKDKLWESYLCSSKEKAKVRYAEKFYKIPLPENSSWKEFEMGELTVRSRLVKSSSFEAKQQSIWKLFPEDLIRPMAVAFGSTIILFLALYLVPKILSSGSEKIDENQYTKLMFDQKTIERQRKKAKKLVKKLEKPKASIKKPNKVAKKNKPVPPPKVNAARKRVISAASSRSKKKVSAKASKVANTIKAAGLSSLVNKVSMRAASNARLIKSSGVKANSKSANRAFASLNDLKKGGQISAAAKTGSFRIGGVKTKGVAGGTSISGSLGGLSGGNVGGASVSSLEPELEMENGLTADQVKKVVQGNIGSVRHCYERQLIANPDLYGKIKVEFVISPQGKVITQKIKTTTMNNKMIEGCILRKIRRWTFPLPKDGSEVAVSYPFYFKSTR